MSRAARLPLVILLLLILAAQSASAQDPTLRGRLFTESGDVAASESLVLVQSESGEEFFVRTDAQGTFELELPPGRYLIYLAGERQRALLQEVSLNGDALRQVDLRRPQRRDDTLEAIRLYELGEVQNGQVATADLTALINPFPQRQQGQYFGSVYWFHRNDNLDARNFFDPAGEPLPEFKRNQFGLTLGAILGPRLTLQGTYEGLRIVQGSTIVSHVPSLAQRLGDFSELDGSIVDPATGEPFPENRIPTDRFSPVAAGLLGIIPAPNQSDPDRNFINSDPRVTDNDSLNVRVDFRPDDVSNLAGNYTLRSGNRVDVRPLPRFSRDIVDDSQNFSLSYNRSLSDTVVTFARIELSRDVNLSLSENADREGLLESLGISGIGVADPIEEGYPNFRITGYAGFGDEGSPNTSTNNEIEAEFSLTFGLDEHTLRTGLEIEGNQLNDDRSASLRRGRFSFSGNFSGDGFADFLLGLVDNASRATGSDRTDLRRTTWQAFVRDDWRLSPNFNLSVGIRYNYLPPYRSIADNVSGLFPLLFETPADARIIIAGTPEAAALGFDDAVSGTLMFPDRNDWAPNIGLAWNPLGSNRLVARASFRIDYRSLERNHFTDSLTRNAPFWVIENVVSQSTVPEIELEAPFEGALNPELGVRGIDPHIRTGYVQNWSASIQNEIARNLTMTISYNGRRGNGMIRTTPGNVPLPGPGQIQPRRPNPAFGQINIIAGSGFWNNNQLNLTAERRFSDGFSFRTGLEWTSSTRDDHRGRPNNPRNLRAEKARAGFVSPKRFFLNYIVDLPFGPGHFLSGGGGSWTRWLLEGWRLSGITEIRDGRPFTVMISGDPDNDGVGGDRPNRLGDGELAAQVRSIDLWFDPTVFALPEEFTFGNSGRNILLSPGRHNWDMSLIKRTAVGDGQLLEFRVAFFNAFNTANFNRPRTTLGTSTVGQIFGSEGGREIEVALKYTF